MSLIKIIRADNIEFIEWIFDTYHLNATPIIASGRHNGRVFRVLSRHIKSPLPRSFDTINSYCFYRRVLGATEDFLMNPFINVNERRQWNGDTILHKFCRNGFVDNTRMVLKHPNIDVNIKNDDNKTALDLAIESKNDECVELIMAHQNK